MFNFEFLEKGLELVSPQNIVDGFSRKIFSCYALLSDQFDIG